jgi:hypothetical protein
MRGNDILTHCGKSWLLIREAANSTKPERLDLFPDKSEGGFVWENWPYGSQNGLGMGVKCQF